MTHLVGSRWRSSAAAWGIAALLCLCLSACGDDDQDKVEAFVEAVTGEVSSARIDHVLTTYLDLARRPLSATVLGDARLYRAEDEAQLKELARSRLQRLAGSSLRTIRRSIEITGEKARVELQLLGDGAMGNVTYQLVKLDDRWVIAEVRVGR